jgi:5-(carboxyamino)imidazole ribonucleotide synthase
VIFGSQHRLREKTFLSGAGFPLTPFRTVRSAADLETAVNDLLKRKLEI